MGMRTTWKDWLCEKERILCDHLRSKIPDLPILKEGEGLPIEQSFLLLIMIEIQSCDLSNAQQVRECLGVMPADALCIFETYRALVPPREALEAILRGGKFIPDLKGQVLISGITLRRAMDIFRGPLQSKAGLSEREWINVYDSLPVPFEAETRNFVSLEEIEVEGKSVIV